MSVALAWGIALSLSACVPGDMLAAKLRDGEVVFTVCDGVQADRVRVLLAKKALFDVKFVEVWRAEGDAFLDPGTEIRYGDAPEGLETQALETMDFSSTLVQFYAQNTSLDGESVYRQMAAQFDGDKLNDETWTLADGSSSDVP